MVNPLLLLDHRMTGLAHVRRIPEAGQYKCDQQSHSTAGARTKTEKKNIAFPSATTIFAFHP